MLSRDTRRVRRAKGRARRRSCGRRVPGRQYIQVVGERFVPTVTGTHMQVPRTEAEKGRGEVPEQGVHGPAGTAAAS